MSANSRDLPEESLASLDEHGNRLFIYPAAVHGIWHNRRLIFQFFLLLIFLALPWIRINGHPAILLNLPERRFAILGLTFWAHDGPMIFFVLATLGVSLALVTAIWGRVWCGWACPQTVFIEMVYRRIEKWIEGNHIERRKLNEGPWNLNKTWRKGLKILAFGAVSAFIGNNFLAYFVGTDRLLDMMRSSPTENPTSFIVMAFVTALAWFDFGWFREQFCIIACPYGRFQSVLMDPQSLAVIYDHHRGEPRKAGGDCINCYKCVAVCPTAIDIRRGVQMECIACTACADACDEVMTKIKKPTGLIRYGSEAELQGQKVTKVRPRVILYSAVLVILIIGFGIALSRREAVPVTILRAIEAPYKLTTWGESEKGVINHFRFMIQNHSLDPVEITIKVVDSNLPIKLVSPLPQVSVAGGANFTHHLFVEFKADLVASTGSLDIPIQLHFKGPQYEEIRRAHFELLGPRSENSKKTDSTP